MSTIVVVRKRGVAVAGADTLTTFGYTKQGAEYIESKTKMLRVDRNVIACCGHASNGLVLEHYFGRREGELVLDSEMAIFAMSLDLHRALKDDYFLVPKEEDDDPYESSQISCLIANPFGIFGLYSLRSVQRFAKFYAFGSGYRVALGAMHAVYDSDRSAEEVARAGLEAAAEFDDGTGAPLEVIAVPLLGSEAVSRPSASSPGSR